MLVLIDQDWARTGDEPTWVVTDGGARRRIVAVDDHRAQISGERVQESTLPHRPRPVQHNRRLLGETAHHHRGQTPGGEASQRPIHHIMIA